MTFDRGHVPRGGAGSAGPEPGTYALKDDHQLVINRANGELFEFTWSLFQDQLPLGLPANAKAISPAPIRAMPWVRQEDRRRHRSPDERRAHRNHGPDGGAPPAGLSTSSVPPSAATRSRSPRRPQPAGRPRRPRHPRSRAAARPGRRAGDRHVTRTSVLARVGEGLGAHEVRGRLHVDREPAALDGHRHRERAGGGELGDGGREAARRERRRVHPPSEGPELVVRRAHRRPGRRPVPLQDVGQRSSSTIAGRGPAAPGRPGETTLDGPALVVGRREDAPLGGIELAHVLVDLVAKPRVRDREPCRRRDRVRQRLVVDDASRRGR